MCSLSSLSAECQLKLFSHTNFRVVLALRLVSRFHRSLVDENPGRLPPLRWQTVTINADEEGIVTIARKGKKKTLNAMNSIFWRHLKCTVLELSVRGGADVVKRLLSILRSSPKHSLRPNKLTVKGWHNVDALVQLPDVARYFRRTVSGIRLENCTLPTEDYPYLTKTTSQLPHMSSLSVGFTVSSWWNIPSKEVLNPFALSSILHICDAQPIMSINLFGMCLTAETVLSLVGQWRQSTQSQHRYTTFFFGSGPTNEVQRQRLTNELLPADKQLSAIFDDRSTCVQHAGRIYFHVNEPVNRVLFIYWTNTF